MFQNALQKFVFGYLSRALPFCILYFVFLYFVFVFEHLSGALCTVWQIADGGGPEGCKASPITDDDEHDVDEYCDEE